MKIKFFSILCCLCGATADKFPICAECLNDLPWILNTCYRCADVGSPVCGNCLRHPPLFHRTISLFQYDDLIGRCIQLLKFNRQLIYARLFGNLFVSVLKKAYQEDVFPQYILPMPLHRSRLVERGYNQALEIAKPIYRAFKCALYKGCVRHKNTMPQSLTLANDRIKNLKNAFSINSPSQAIHIAILDDVVTTGATVTSLTHVLKKSGATRVDVWCVARTVLTKTRP